MVSWVHRLRANNWAADLPREGRERAAWVLYHYSWKLARRNDNSRQKHKEILQEKHINIWLCVVRADQKQENYHRQQIEGTKWANSLATSEFWCWRRYSRLHREMSSLRRRMPHNATRCVVPSVVLRAKPTSGAECESAAPRTASWSIAAVATTAAHGTGVAAAELMKMCLTTILFEKIRQINHKSFTQLKMAKSKFKMRHQTLTKLIIETLSNFPKFSLFYCICQNTKLICYFSY